MVALLFALHPIQVESVAWVVELKNLQSGFFALAAFLCYLRHRTIAVRPAVDDRDGNRLMKGLTKEGALQGWSMYGFCVFFYACALLSKTSVMTLPFSLFLADWLLANRAQQPWLWGSLARVAPMLAVGILMGLITISVEKGLAPEDLPPLGLRPLIASAAMWFYVGKLLLPVDLVPIYPRWEVSYDQWWLWVAMVGSGLTLVGLWAWRQQVPGLLLWGIGHFVVSLSPALGFIPFGYLEHAFVADHFTYVASIGFFLVLAVALQRGVEHIRGAAAMRCIQRWLGVGATCIVIVGLVGMTRAQVTIWHDPLTFWSYVVEENPRSASAHNNLGSAYLLNNHLGDAETHYRQALRLRPNSSSVHYGLGLIFSRQGRLEEAIQAYRQAIFYQPLNWKALASLALTYGQLGQLDDAIKWGEVAVTMATARGRRDAVVEINAMLHQYQFERSQVGQQPITQGAP